MNLMAFHRGRSALAARLAAAGIAALAVVANVGCDPVDQVGRDIDNAITAISVQNADLKATLDNLVHELQGTIPEAQQAVADMANGIAEELNTAVQCGIDEVRARVVDGLRYVKEVVVKKGPGSPPTPWTCDFNPTFVSLVGSSPTGPWTVDANGNSGDWLVVWGTGFTKANLPQVDLVDKDGKVQASKLIQPARETYYKVGVALGGINFATVGPGSRLRLSWPSGGVDPNDIPIQLTEHLVQTGHINDTIIEYAPPSGLFDPNKNCLTFPSSVTLPEGEQVDTSQGTSGVSLIAVDDNRQAASTETVSFSLNADQRTVQFSVRICGANNDGPGARFDHTYAIFWIQPYTVTT